MPRLFAFTLDVEPDFLSENGHEVLLDEQRMRLVTSLLAAHGVKVTAFVTGQMLAAGLPIVERLEGVDSEFELHSYSHRNDEPDSAREIVRGKEEFYRYFGRAPIGYRAPSGRISSKGAQILHSEGFLYDSSVFPAWRPELGYNFSRLPTTPWRFRDLPGLMEIPFGVIPGSRLVISLSFLKLFGLRAYRNMFRAFGMPSVLVFDSHLYDFFLTSAVLELPGHDWRRYALTRNQSRVFELLSGFLDFLRSAGYEFVLVSDIYRRMRDSDLPLVSSRRLLTPRGQDGWGQWELT